MVKLPHIPIVFTSENAANRLVAGIPAAARAVANIAEQNREISEVIVAVPGGWRPSAYCCEEVERLSPGIVMAAVDAENFAEDDTVFGAALLGVGEVKSNERLNPETEKALLDKASWSILAATGKSTDGIVSRYINRPISRSMSRSLLKTTWARPGHATALAAALGLAMMCAFIWGGGTGLLVGAVLFQAASIVDGVDGEMARATRRSSERGAMLDSLTDAATNLGFLAGVSFNVWQQGLTNAAIAGVIGFLVLGVGSALLGRQARQAGGDFTFDAMKHRMRAKPSLLKQGLIYLTMRDFYAFAACLAILAGLVVPLLYAFATIACGWFIVVCATFVLSSRSG